MLNAPYIYVIVVLIFEFGIRKKIYYIPRVMETNAAGHFHRFQMYNR